MSDPMPGPARRALAVVDVDGVVADVRHRLGHLQRRPSDWDAFFAAASADPPLAAGVARVAALAEEHEVAYLTGRPERLRAVTTRWLAAHGLPSGHLEMRRDNDRRAARVFKRSALRRLASDRVVAVVLDDDPDVVRALRADGWPVEQADWVPYGPAQAETLHAAQEETGRT